MAEDEDKYAYLLNPIKDLQKNWDIDLQDILSKYIEQLNNIADEEELGLHKRQTVDFAEASKVIQGTSSIYSKKVDFVYDDVVAFKSMLSDQKGKKNKKNAKGEEEDEEGVVDLDPAAAHSYELKDYSKLKRCDMVSLCLKSGQKRALTVPLMPMSLMPLADYEKCNVPMYARKRSKEVIGKKDDFKMNTAHINDDGAILLDLLNRNLIGKKYAQKEKKERENMDPLAFLSQGSRLTTQVALPSLPSSQALPTSQPFASQSFQSYGSHDADNEVAAMMGRRTSSLMPVEGLREGSVSRACISTIDDRRKTEHLRPSTRFNMSVVQEDYEDDMGNDGFDDSMGAAVDVDMENMENIRPARVRGPVVKKKEAWEEEGDPFEDNDSDEFTTVKWRRSAAIRAQTRLNTKKLLAAKQKEAASMDARKRAMETLDYLNEFVYPKKIVKKPKGGEQNWSKMVLSKLIARTKKAREAEKKRMKKILLKEQGMQHEEEEEVFKMDDDDDHFGGFDDDGIHEGMDMQPFAASTPKHGDDYERRGTVMYGGDDDMGGGEREGIDMMDDANGMPRGTFDDMTDDDFRAQGMGSLFGPNCDTTIGAADELYWLDEDRMEKRMASVNNKNGEKEEIKETMSMRIHDWSSKVVPLLEEEEEFKEFDIHHYGNTMLQVFDDVGEKRVLPQMVKGCHKREVSRYMLSVLMMANTYNVTVKYEDNDKDVVPMHVSLLKKERHHEVFDQEEAFL